jgi:hypothetical protein
VKLTVISLPFDELAGFDPGPLEQFCDANAVTAPESGDQEWRIRSIIPYPDD